MVIGGSSDVDQESMGAFQEFPQVSGALFIVLECWKIFPLYFYLQTWPRIRSRDNQETNPDSGQNGTTLVPMNAALEVWCTDHSATLPSWKKMQVFH